MSSIEKPDHWSATKYAAAANFVPLLTTKVLQYLDPQPGDKILDIGCGDGQLTQTIASKISSNGHILGLDASPSFIQSARAQNAHPEICAYELQDCTDLSTASSLNEKKEPFDKIFSNAALHWILRAPSTRKPLFQQLHSLLAPNEFHTAFTAALTTHGGLSLDEARAASPWFFPSEAWMRGVLEEVGFEVEVCESEYRPTKVTDDGGLEAWVRLMGASFLDAVQGEERKEEVVRAVCGWVEGAVVREEDGSRWIGYVRLRAVGRKR
jgi:trans-aconitate methyltransferase